MPAEYYETGLKWEPLKGEKRVHSGLAFLSGAAWFPLAQTLAQLQLL
jgi:hypothetical protein